MANEKQYQYLVGIAIIVLLVLIVYVSGRVSELEATVFGTGEEAPGAGSIDESDLLGYTYGAYDPYYDYGGYDSYYDSYSDPYDTGYSY